MTAETVGYAIGSLIATVTFAVLLHWLGAQWWEAVATAYVVSALRGIKVGK